MQTHKIATVPTNQLPVCVSAHHHCVRVWVVQALFFHALCATAYSSAPLCSFCHFFAQVELTVQALWQGKVELLSSSLLSFLACSPSGVQVRTIVHPCSHAINSVVATGLTQQTLHLGGCDTPLKCWVDSSAKSLRVCLKMDRALKYSSKSFLRFKQRFTSLPPHSKQIVLTDKSRIMVRRFARQQDYGS